MNENRFYIYALLDPRKPGRYEYGDICFLYEPFYIGKGTERRCYDHFKPSQIKKCKNPHLCRKISKIQKNNQKIIILKIKTLLTETQSFQLEIEFINLIGKTNDGGILTNIYDGGYGETKSLETKRKISQTVKQWHQDNSHPCLGKKHSKETREKISKARKGFKMTKEWRDKMVKTKLLKKSGALWYKMISPDNEEFKIHGLSPFCENHNLHSGHMSSVANGKRKQHKGWICFKI
jgi:hypothetical protein